MKDSAEDIITLYQQVEPLRYENVNKDRRISDKDIQIAQIMSD